MRPWLDAVLGEAGLGPAESVTVLGGGTFNTVVRVGTSGGDVVVKVAPGPELRRMSYEDGIMATEALYYRLAAEHGVASVPRTIHYGQTGGVEALVLSVVPGQPWPQVAAGLDDGQRYELRAAVGRELAALHAIEGRGFGYPARPLAATWREAYLGMIAMVLDDARRYGVELPGGPDRVGRVVERHSPVLDDVRTPVLVHFDLWDGNILVATDGSATDGSATDGSARDGSARDGSAAGPVLGGLIDAERAFWGDPVAELVSLRLFGELEPDAGLLAGYLGAGGRFVLDESVRLRLDLYRLYLYLIMWVEAVPRDVDTGHIDWLRRMVRAPLATMLDALEGTAPAAG